MPTIVPFETLAELPVNLANKYAGSNKAVFHRKPDPKSEYTPIYWDQVIEDVHSLASYMLSKGIEHGDRVGILSENRYEWAVVDLAIQMIGGINVSLYTTLPASQCEYILQDSETRMFFVSTGIQLKKAVEVYENCEQLIEIIAFDNPKNKTHASKDFVHLFEDVLNEGAKQTEKYKSEIKKRVNAVSVEDISTLIYTSGTTGRPKGAMLTHQNIVSNVKAATKHIYWDDKDRLLSFLPLCHSFERTAGYYAIISCGAEIYYAESVDTVSKNMPEVKPTVMISVPRLFEKIYNLIVKSVEEGSDTKKKVFNWAVETGRKYASGKRGLVSVQKKIADKLVFNKLKERTGGQIRLFVSGGAALPPDIDDFFKAAGLTILQGYGLTETSPVMAANKVGEEITGVVGAVIPGVTVAIKDLNTGAIIAQISGEDYPTSLTSEPGEILCKGPNVMKGYWRNEEATKEMIDDDGWLHTGDVGRFVEGNLKITDRIKHMIVNAGGKNIYPGPIEDMFKTSKWIDQMVVVGEAQNFMAGLIVPDFEVLAKYAKDNGLDYKDNEVLISHPEIVEIFKKEIRTFSKDLASHEKIRDFRLLPNEFTVETGEITPTMKVKRRVIAEKYADQISSIFKDDIG
ncbi:MAG: long-chain fatty acid--CoA ligase [Balneola sp.]|jgi:long-chain acyl-CoA synthetase|nr:long-chain fatty acid--CoA ligase [Balneola sp.]MAO78414.1 long-chain fatty acid--CoA ligase [Balneola sp.]MBF64414.1 long-chain fatty acid--CoA ligase [Balneola sp.]|tara:strand:- start:28013 stop:29896 length:1884 start_codon:yes stop_codon:yes gene_type:complete